MNSGVAEILTRAKELSKRFTLEYGPQLEAVRDRTMGVVVPSWRHNGAVADFRLHKMMSRVGGFPASLARYFIVQYSKAGDVVLDPFCGKGTTLLEALALGRSAVGGDIAPDAVLVSRAKCSGVSIAEAANYIEAFDTTRRVSVSDVPRDVSLFFSRGTLLQLLSIRKQLLEDMESRKKRRIATFVCGVLLGILHGHSQLSLSLPCNQVFAMSPNYVRRYVLAHGLKRPNRDVRECLLMKTLELLPGPRLAGRARVVEAAAQRCRSYVKGVFACPDMILTSPPYLDRQTYIKDSWLRLWFLGRQGSELTSESMETGSVNLFLQYMQSALESMVGVLKIGGRMVLVCGRANVDAGGMTHSVRVGDLCLYAIDQSEVLRSSLLVERLIVDRILMVRGSYFAVHHGKTDDDNGGASHRFGEDEILVVRKLR